MKLKSFFCALIATTTLTFTACSDDAKHAKIPVFDTITLTPNPCMPGDTVTAVVKYKSLGEYYYFFKENYTVGENSYTIEKSDCKGTNVEPTFKLVAPADKYGTFPVTFIATVSLTAGSTLYSTTNKVETKLIVKDPDGDYEE